MRVPADRGKVARCRNDARSFPLGVGHRVRRRLVPDRGSKSRRAMAQTIRLAADGREFKRIVVGAANVVTSVFCRSCSDLHIAGLFKWDYGWRDGGVLARAIR